MGKKEKEGEGEGEEGAEGGEGATKQPERIDLGLVILQKIVEQMKAMNSTVGSGSGPAFDKDVCRRVGLPRYGEYIAGKGRGGKGEKRRAVA